MGGWGELGTDGCAEEEGGSVVWSGMGCGGASFTSMRARVRAGCVVGQGSAGGGDVGQGAAEVAPGKTKPLEGSWADLN